MMKNIFLFSFVLISGLMFSQQVIFEETFENFETTSGEDFTDNGWVLNNVDGVPVHQTYASYFPDNAAWTVLSLYDNENKFAASASWLSVVGSANRWMVTPPIDLSDFESCSLQFKSRAYDPVYPEGFELYISVTGTDVSDFEVLLYSIQQESTTAWVQNTIDLSDYDGQTIYLAWRQNSFYSSMIFIDDIIVSGTYSDNNVPVLQLNNSIYTTGEQIEVTFGNGPGNLTDWIGIYAGESSPGNGSSYVWVYTTGQTNNLQMLTEGTVSFNSLPPGTYRAYFLENNGHNVLAGPVYFTVRPQQPGVSGQTVCYGAVLSDLEAEGENIKWYLNQEDEDILPMATLLDTGTYYVSQTVNGVESERVAVEVTVTTVPSPGGLVSQGFESESFGTITLANLVVTGENIVWYATEEDALAGENELEPDTLLEENTAYYAMQEINGCRSISPLAVTAVSIPVQPVVSDQAVCYGAVLSDLEAEGENIKWYLNQEDEDILPMATLLDTGTYYVSQTVNGVESERVAVEVTVTTVPSPGGLATQGFALVSFGTITLANLVVTGENIVWYATEEDALAGENELEPDTLLVVNTTYYAMQEVDGCMSISPLAVQVTTATLNVESYLLPEVKVYPNPTRDILQIEASEPIESVQVFNLLGQRLLSFEGVGNVWRGSLSELSNATYIVQVKINNRDQLLKVVKQ